jgi:hypothetical protein
MSRRESTPKFALNSALILTAAGIRHAQGWGLKAKGLGDGLVRDVAPFA